MFISKIEIDNFRCFKETKVNLHEGINILIGYWH
ncbi:AAA family ATPase [Pseudogracilibacillus sp. SO30301A]